MGQRIVIPATSKDCSDLASNRFARCNYFAIYNKLTESCDWYENLAKGESSGAGNKAAKILGDLGADIVLVPEVGPKAYDMLRAFDIEVYKYDKEKTVKEVVKAFLNRELVKVVAPSVKGKH